MAQRLCLKRCSYSSTLGETVADIEELLTEILVRVPARPLVRFKCVSKRWLSLISDPKFCHRHTLRNPHPSISAIFTNASTDFYHITLDHLEQCDTSTNPGNKRIPASAARNPLNFVPHLYGTYIVQSCNGLFLCLPDPPIGSPPIINHPYYVLNPTTNQFSTLVPPAAAAATTHQRRIFGYALAFDPFKSPHYKVVFLWSVNEPVDGYCRLFHIEIYSSDTQSWRLLDSSFNRFPNVKYREGVYCNGAVHWVGMDREMLYYHIDEERVGFVMPSEERCRRPSSRYFWESHGGGHLHLIDVHQLNIPFEVLEMGKDYSGWFVKYRVDLNPIFTAYPQLSPICVIFLFIAREETEGEDSSSLLLHIPGKVISYDLRSNTLKYFKLPAEVGGDDFNIRVHKFNYPYTESLACV